MKYVGVIMAALVVAACAHNSTRVERVSLTKIRVMIPPLYYDDGGVESWNGLFVIEPSSEVGAAPRVAIVLAEDDDAITGTTRAIKLHARFLKVEGMAWTYRIATFKDGSAINIIVLFNGEATVVWPCSVIERTPITRFAYDEVQVCASGVCGELRKFACDADSGRKLSFSF